MECKLWVAFDQHHLVGALQLSLCTKGQLEAQGPVEKLMVPQPGPWQGGPRP